MLQLASQPSSAYNSKNGVQLDISEDFQGSQDMDVLDEEVVGDVEEDTVQNGDASQGMVGDTQTKRHLQALLHDFFKLQMQRLVAFGTKN